MTKGLLTEGFEDKESLIAPSLQGETQTANSDWATIEPLTGAVVMVMLFTDQNSAMGRVSIPGAQSNGGQFVEFLGIAPIRLSGN